MTIMIPTHTTTIKIKCLNCKKKFSKKVDGIIDHFGPPSIIDLILKLIPSEVDVGVCQNCISNIGENYFINESSLDVFRDEVQTDRLRFNPILDTELKAYMKEKLEKSQQIHTKSLSQVIDSSINSSVNKEQFLTELGVSNWDIQKKRSIVKYYHFAMDLKIMSNEDKTASKKSPTQRKETVLNKIVYNWEENEGFYDKEIKNQVDLYCTQYKLWEDSLNTVKLILIDSHDYSNWLNNKASRAIWFEAKLPKTSIWHEKMESLYSKHPNLNHLSLIDFDLEPLPEIEDGSGIVKFEPISVLH
jgi:hypothetical protein